MLDHFSLAGKRVFVAGHQGMVGSAICRRLERQECLLLTASRAELDLQNQRDVETWFEKCRPDAVFLAAAKVGGIAANMLYPATFLYDNLMIQANVINAAYESGVSKLMTLGSSCIYPANAPQPISEDALLSGALESTNEPYAVAKIAGIKMAQSYQLQYGLDCISIMPPNLYGPGDRYDPILSHVIPAIILKAHVAKIEQEPFVGIWGTGSARREFLFVDDLADACVFLMESYSDGAPINVGYGVDYTIAEIAQLVFQAVGYTGGAKFDHSKPDGVARKLLDSSRLNLMGWTPTVGLSEGIALAYRWFLQNRT